ncbi:FtsX-like permease family protein [Halorubrum sp. CBA1125]|uniref:ABC transporter permease n=1 Tax=Halorubrum sp. CBA1125 TaxID=2668072 RepID=UPI0012E95897|nr:ABC transporter permease [Halorubrum sp. CBA1125]MUW13793.1 FtsX-like permease family protein [Halorubrum sp. CBA1125]
MAWRNLGRNRVRTALAMLGVVIGVMAIASLGMAGVALEHQATSNLGDLTNEVSVSPGEDIETDGVTDDQVETIRDVAPATTVIPQKTNGTELTARNGESAYVQVTGVTNAAPLYDIAAGDEPTRLETGALISESTAQTLDLEMGDPVEYEGQIYRIRGFIAAESGFGPSGGGELVLPVSALREQEYYDSVTVVTEDGDTATATANTIEEHFNDEDDEILSVTSFASVQENISSFTDTLELALLGIGSISLFVASVAILNVMLMSTIERRGEIGVLRAVGVRRGEVLRMILTEAAFLGGVGGVFGAVGSLAVGLVLFHVITGDAALALAWSSSRYLLYGVVFALVASVLSGIYPAWKAANESPVEALRG